VAHNSKLIGLISPAVHIAILLSIIVSCTPTANVVLTPKYDVVGVTLVPPQGDTTVGNAEGPPGALGVLCGKDREYIGAGFVHSPLTGIISEAPIGYPAYTAGIRINDVFMSMTPDSVHKIGDVIRVGILRKGKEMFFNIKARKICYANS
jgi:membrane-associated protease RseP (regulator of RpoE activity)